MKHENTYEISIEFNDRVCRVAYFDTFSNSPQIMDFSGGYGKRSLPVLVQYDYEKQRFYYENQVELDNKNAVNLTQLLDHVVKDTTYEINEKKVSATEILVNYINHVIAKFKEINPLSKIESVMVVFEEQYSFIYKEKLNEVKSSINANYLYVMNKTTALIHYLSKNSGVSMGKILIIDYGSTNVSLLKVHNTNDEMKILESYYDCNFSSNRIKSIIFDEIKDSYNHVLRKNTNTEYEIEMLQVMAEKYFSAIINGILNGKDITIYYNFSLPAFKHSLKCSFMDEYMNEFKNNMTVYFSQLNCSEIDKVICIGNYFQLGNVLEGVRKKCNAVVSFEEEIYVMGGAICAHDAIYSKLNLDLIDGNSVKYDYGVKSLNEFICLVKKGTIYNNVSPLTHEFIIDYECGNDARLTVFRENGNDLINVKEIIIEKKNCIDNKQRIGISLNVIKFDEVEVYIEYLEL